MCLAGGLPKPPLRQARGRTKFQVKHPLLMAAGAGYAPEVPASWQRPPDRGSEGWATGLRPQAEGSTWDGEETGARRVGGGLGPASHYPSFFSFFSFFFSFFFFGFLEDSLNSCVYSAPSGSCSFRCC